jgi:Asp-tRNA(Asn)/Glu-tRNA(Gln) amidotransferase A subunit family amidase
VTEELTYLSATALSAAMRRGDVSPVEVVDAVIARVEEANPHINAFVTLTLEDAKAQARSAERAISRGTELGPLAGVPITVKDETDTAGVRTTYGSTGFRDHVPTEDALSWARMKAAGAILIGKTTMPEFGMKGITESALTGVTNNPWSASRTAGGSSGGAAAAVVSGCAPLAWGSDSGGSIRIPAAYCGAVGLKPSMGRVRSSTPDWAFESVSTEGPITRTAADAALLLSVTAGPDAREPLALPAADVDFVEAARRASVAGWRIAYSPDLGQARVAREVLELVAPAAEVFERQLGASVEEVEIELPDAVDYFFDYYGPQMAAFFGSLTTPGDETDLAPLLVAPLLERARSMTAVDLWQTLMDTRGRIAMGFADVLESFDVLLTPTSPVAAFPHPGDVGGNTHVDGMPVAHPFVDFHRLTEPPSHVGLPAITIPCGFTSAGLPVGLQIIGRHHADDAVLAAAAAYEQATDWHLRRPSFGSPTAK